MISKKHFHIIRIFIVMFSVMLFTHLWAQKQEQSQESYTMGPNDLITVNVFGVRELNNARVRISGNGTVTLPLVGEIKAAGLTSSQLEAHLAEILEKNYLKNAQVSVFIQEHQSQRVAVMGAVTRPGSYEMPGSETLLQLLSRAGGLTDRASSRAVIISGDKSQIVDLEELMTKGTPALNIKLKPGDVVNIPHEKYIDIYIFGEVRRPGTMQLKRSGQVTLLKAIAQAGGFSNRANKSGIVVKRKINGKVEKIKVNINKIIKGKVPPFVLQHDDIIFVPQSLF